MLICRTIVYSNPFTHAWSLGSDQRELYTGKMDQVVDLQSGKLAIRLLSFLDGQEISRNKRYTRTYDICGDFSFLFIMKRNQFDLTSLLKQQSRSMISRSILYMANFHERSNGDNLYTLFIPCYRIYTDKPGSQPPVRAPTGSLRGKFTLFRSFSYG